MGWSYLIEIDGNDFFVLSLQWFLSQTINNFDDVKFESASVLATLYTDENQSVLAKPLLRKAIELSNASVYWHCRLIFQLAVSHINILVVYPYILVDRCTESIY